MPTVPDVQRIIFLLMVLCCGVWQENDKLFSVTSHYCSSVSTKSNSKHIWMHLWVCVCTISSGSPLRLCLWRRVNFVFALVSTLIDLLRFASSLYVIFPYEPLKEDGRSLQDVMTQCTDKTDWMSDSNILSVTLHLDCLRWILISNGN